MEPQDIDHPAAARGEAPSGAAFAVEIDRVTKTFSNVAAVREVTLPIRRGEFLTLLGPSGCGKTTLLNLIAGFLEPSAGQVRIDGRDVTTVPPYLRDTGMVFQNYALFPHMNVFDNVAFGLRMRKLPKEQIAQEVAQTLEMVELAGMAQRRARQLSGGQQQRVALARAIVIRPKVLLLDEPLSALDKNLRAEMQIELKKLHQKTGLTTVFVTHDQGEALSLSDRIVVMNQGAIQQISTPIELYRRPATGFVASFIGEINRLPLAVCSIEGPSMLFELAPQIRLAARRRADAGLQGGQRVHLFVRPEHISVAQPQAGPENVVAGRVATHIYQGTHTLTQVEVDGLGMLVVRVPGGDVIDRSPAGSPINLVISLDEAIILPE